jgi:DNA-binding response OmpR family regulator
MAMSALNHRILAGLGAPEGLPRYRVGDLELDWLPCRVTRANQEIVLQALEFRLLEYLMKYTGQVVTRTMLRENVWNYHFDPQTHVIEVNIWRLRSKIDKGFSKPLLHTLRGVGYLIHDCPQCPCWHPCGSRDAAGLYRRGATAVHALLESRSGSVS